MGSNIVIPYSKKWVNLIALKVKHVENTFLRVNKTLA